MPLLPSLALHLNRRLTTSWIVFAGLASLYLFNHPYFGLRHDALLYALQALRRIYPDSLSGDLFFKFGSQDNYTIFSVAYAALIGRFDLDDTALVLTRLVGVAEIVAALLLARALMDRHLAWLATALFVGIAGRYGAADLFAYGESFLTPRPLAETLVLLGLALTLGGAGWAALACMLGALAIHPLMALPGLLVLALLRFPRHAPALGVATLAGLGAMLAAAHMAPFGAVRLMDSEWRGIVADHLPYLFASKWTILDYQRALLPLATLGIAYLVLPVGSARRLAVAALGVGGLGVTLTMVSDDLAPIALLIEGQPWRFTWLSKAVAVLLIAPVAQALWQRGTTGRALLALLSVAWFGSEEALGLESALCAVAATLIEYRSARPRPARALVIALLAVAFAAAEIALVGLPLPMAAIGVAVVAWWAAFKAPFVAARAGVAIGIAVLFAYQIADTLNAPTYVRYDALAQELAPWQTRVAPDQTVLFAGETPVDSSSGAWLALHRRGYVTAAGVVFSRETAMEAQTRFAALAARAGEDTPWFLGVPTLMHPQPPNDGTLARVCTTPGLDFVVTPMSFPSARRSLTPTPLASLFLYDCRVVREEEPRV